MMGGQVEGYQQTALEQGQFAEKGLWQRFLFMPYVKEHIRLDKRFQHWFSASVANL